MEPYYDNSLEKTFTVLLILIVPALVIMLMISQG